MHKQSAKYKKYIPLLVISTIGLLALGIIVGVNLGKRPITRMNPKAEGIAKPTRMPQPNSVADWWCDGPDGYQYRNFTCIPNKNQNGAANKLCVIRSTTHTDLRGVDSGGYDANQWEDAPTAVCNTDKPVAVPCVGKKGSLKADGTDNISCCPGLEPNPNVSKRAVYNQCVSKCIDTDGTQYPQLKCTPSGSEGVWCNDGVIVRLPLADCQATEAFYDPNIKKGGKGCDYFFYDGQCRYKKMSKDSPTEAYFCDNGNEIKMNSVKECDDLANSRKSPPKINYCRNQPNQCVQVSDDSYYGNSWIWCNENGEKGDGSGGTKEDCESSKKRWDYWNILPKGPQPGDCQGGLSKSDTLTYAQGLCLKVPYLKEPNLKMCYQGGWITSENPQFLCNNYNRSDNELIAGCMVDGYKQRADNIISRNCCSKNHTSDGTCGNASSGSSNTGSGAGGNPPGTPPSQDDNSYIPPNQPDTDSSDNTYNLPPTSIPPQGRESNPGGFLDR